MVGTFFRLHGYRREVRDEFTIPLMAVLAYIAATAAIFVVPWEGTAAIVVLAALQFALGLAIGRWWVLILPIPLLAILLAPSTNCTGELCGGGFYAFFLAWYVGVACALAAVGVVARQLIVRRRVASAAARTE
jgi:hypothetical protein